MRFERAVRGRSRRDAPDLDHRGWDMHRPSGWNSTEARGPMFGVMVGDTVRLKILREDLDAATPLYVTVSQAAEPQVEVAEPAGGGPLPADGIVRIRGVADTSSGQTVEVRLGGVEGPVIAEAEPHVFERKTLLVTPHIVSINTAANAASASGEIPLMAADVTRIFDIVKAVYRPIGIDVRVATAVDLDVFNAAANDRCFVGTGPTNAVAHINQVTQQGWVAGRVNVYYVSWLEGSLGIGLNKDTKGMASCTNPACVIAVRGNFNGIYRRPTDQDANDAHLIRALGNDTAHEIGHFLTLWHADNQNNPGRRDTYARRQLMHPMNLLPARSTNAAIRSNDVGYGKHPGSGRAHRGCMLTLKDLPSYAETGNLSGGSLQGASGSEASRIRGRMNHADLYGP